MVTLLSDLRGSLALGGAVGIMKSQLPDDLAESVPGLLDHVDRAVSQGRIGYWLYVGRNPG